MSTFAAEGSYHAVADTVFNKTGVDVFFMEYDTERAGDLDPLGESARQPACHAGLHHHQDRRAGADGPAEAAV